MVFHFRDEVVKDTRLFVLFSLNVSCFGRSQLAAVRTLSLSCRRLHDRELRPLPVASKELSFAAYSHMSVPSGKWIFYPTVQQSWPTAWTVTSQEALSQNLLAELFLDF